MTPALVAEGRRLAARDRYRQGPQFAPVHGIITAALLSLLLFWLPLFVAIGIYRS